MSLAFCMVNVVAEGSFAKIEPNFINLVIVICWKSFVKKMQHNIMVHKKSRSVTVISSFAKFRTN